MSAIIAEVAGRKALVTRPTVRAPRHSHSGELAYPRPMMLAAFAVSDATSVGLRPIRSASTPPTTPDTLAPTPYSAATRPAKSALRCIGPVR